MARWSDTWHVVDKRSLCPTCQGACKIPIRHPLAVGDHGRDGLVYCPTCAGFGDIVEFNLALNSPDYP